MKFEGCCTYPHGHCLTLGLLGSVCGAFAATGYAVASCRFVVASYSSRWGPVEDALGAPSSGGDQATAYRSAAGLFQWLEPFAPEDFNEGACSGYRTTMLDALAEPLFEAARVAAVVSVLISLLLIGWVLTITMLSMQRREIWFLRLLCFVNMALVALMFLILESSLCTSVGDDTSCVVDEGGLVAIAAIILWFVCLLIVCVFVKPLGSDLVIMDGELKSAFAERQAERRRRAEERYAERKREEAVRKSSANYAAGAGGGEDNDEPLRTPSKSKRDVESQATPQTVSSPADTSYEGGEGMEVAYNSPSR